MKKLLVTLTIVFTTISFTSCNDYDFSGEEQALIKENAESILGLIDPNQDWNSVYSGTVTIHADAPLYNVAKVQILTESPFLNPSASVLAEAEAEKGQSVTLSYDAPNTYTRLIAACIDQDGHYYIKGFNINETEVEYKTSAAQTRIATRGKDDYPDASALKLEFSKSQQSYNAMRTIFVNEAYDTNDANMLSVVTKASIDDWHNAGWEDDRLWMPNDNSSTGSTWIVSEGSIHRQAASMSDEEKENLEDLFGDFFTRTSTGVWNRKDNLEIIRNSPAVRFYNNQLISDGTTPVTITPIWMPSSEIMDCHLYYYYYNVSAIPEGTSEEDYIKALPKFKAIHCSQALYAAQNQTSFAKGYEYLLPYYGEPSAFMPTINDVKDFCTTDGKIYRIRCGGQRNNEDYYMVYSGTDSNKMDTWYSDDANNVGKQLWQVFSASDGNKLLYNIGAGLFLTWSGYWDTPYSNSLSAIKNGMFKFDDDHHIIRHKDRNKFLGVNWGDASKINNMNIASDKNSNIGEYSKWYFEEYTGEKVKAVQNVQLKEYPATVTAISTIIPEGYKIGFMLRKLKDTGPYVDGYRPMTDGGHGCCYGFGGLNREINNNSGHFGSSKNVFTMEADDPRAAIFNANARTYIAFEDGSDCQYNDIVFEIGGYDSSVLEEAPLGAEEKSCGVETAFLYDEEEIPGQAYMLCFEDRPTQADYDLNDVVLRCTRLNATEVELSLIAAGAFDEVVIQGIPGEFVEGYRQNGREVHEIFRKQDAEGYDRYINTVKDATFLSPKSAIYKIDKDMTIPQFLSKIYIENRTTGQTIEVAKTGDSPCGIIIPSNFDYPMENERITDAYALFSYWVKNASNFKDWYSEKNANEEKIILVHSVLKQNQ